MALRGNIDTADRQRVRGWVREEDQPSNPVSLTVQVDGNEAGRVLANAFRMDLEAAGIGNGRHGYVIRLEGLSPATPHTVRITREQDGIDVPGSPLMIPPSLVFDAEMQQHLATMLGDVDSEEELGRRATFLALQADRLLQRRADKRTGREHPGERQFRVRWTGRGPNPHPDPAPRVLFIDDSLPVETRDAGSRALVSHMRGMQRLGFAVSVAPADMSGGDAAAALAALGITACGAPWSGSVEEVLRREAGSFALIYLHRASNTRYLPLIRHYQPRARVVFSVADLQHVRLARQAQVEERPELAEAAQRIRAAELSAARFVEAVITHSSFEAELLRRDVPGAKVHLVPWAVTPRPTAVPFAERRGLAFIGSYGHAPNLDAAWWLIQEIMPLVRNQDPALECLLVGSNMPDTLRVAVAPGIQPVGSVDDIASVFDQVRLTVAPLAFGAGVKGKVLDSLAAGVPCACTPIAAEGLNLPGPLGAMVAEGAEGLAQTICRLHGDAALNAACSEAGLAYVADQLSEARLDALLREVAGPALRT